MVENGEVIETIKTPLNPGSVAVTNGGLVGIVGVKGLALEVYEADTLDSVDIIDAGKGPTHVEAGPDDRFYVADTRGDALLVYETHPELELAASVPLPGGAPYGTRRRPPAGSALGYPHRRKPSGPILPRWQRAPQGSQLPDRPPAEQRRRGPGKRSCVRRWPYTGGAATARSIGGRMLGKLRVS